MKSYFYRETLYREFEADVPAIYLEIDELFEKINNHFGGFYNFELPLITNVCKRQADVEFWKMQVINKYNENGNPFDTAVLISTLIISYFNSCQSLVDSIAVLINFIYDLKLNPIDQDLGREKFQKKVSDTSLDYFNSYKDFYKDLKTWRNIASHNIYPAVSVCGTTEVRNNILNYPNLREEVDIVIFKEHPYYGVKEFFSIIKFFDDWTATLNEITYQGCKEFKSFVQMIVDRLQEN